MKAEKDRKRKRKKLMSENNQSTGMMQAKAPDNHASETHVTKVQTPTYSHTL